MVFFPNMDSSPKRFNIEQNMLRHFDVNLVSNGTFDTDSDWAKSTGVTISGGKLNFEVVGGAYTYAQQALNIYEVGKTYKLSFTINGTSGKQFRVRDDVGNAGGLNLSNGVHTLDGTDQQFELIFTATSGSDEIIFERSPSGGGVWNFSVDNVKLQEYGTSGYVTTLYDQTGNNCHALQATASYQPQIVSGGDLIKSGNRPAWEYIVSNPQRNLRVQGVEGVSTLDAFFVAETSDAALGYPVDPSVGYRYGLVAEDSSTNTTLSSSYGSPVLEINGVQQSPSTRDDVHTAYQGRKLVYHRSASTSGWGNVDMGYFAGITNYSLNIENTKFSEWIWYDSDQSSNPIDTAINDHYNIY